MKSTAHYLRVTLALTCSASISACGGGDANQEPSVNLGSLSFGAAQVTAPTTGSSTISLAFSATTAGSPAGYDVAAYAFLSSSNSRVKNDSTRFFGRSCNAAAPCSTPQTQACTFNSSRTLSCSIGSAVNLPAGTYTIVGEACVYNSAMQYLCSTRETTLVAQ
jgi:hypothetical protein